MANNHGGARTPRNPAPVSGPGAMSKRTDGSPAKPAYVSGMPYGEGQDFYDLQTSSPMGAQAAQPRSRSGNSAPQGGLVPFGAPTQRPDEPVTAGNPLGEGPGLEALSLPPSPRAADTAVLAKYLPQLRAIAASGDAPAGFKAFVQYLNGA